MISEVRKQKKNMSGKFVTRICLEKEGRRGQWQW